MASLRLHDHQPGASGLRRQRHVSGLRARVGAPSLHGGVRHRRGAVWGLGRGRLRAGPAGALQPTGSGVGPAPAPLSLGALPSARPALLLGRRMHRALLLPLPGPHRRDLPRRSRGRGRGRAGDRHGPLRLAARARARAPGRGRIRGRGPGVPGAAPGRRRGLAAHRRRPRLAIFMARRGRRPSPLAIQGTEPGAAAAGSPNCRRALKPPGPAHGCAPVDDSLPLRAGAQPEKRGFGAAANRHLHRRRRHDPDHAL